MDNDDTLDSGVGEEMPDDPIPEVELDDYCEMCWRCAWVAWADDLAEHAWLRMYTSKVGESFAAFMRRCRVANLDSFDARPGFQLFAAGLFDTPIPRDLCSEAVRQLPGEWYAAEVYEALVLEYEALEELEH